MGEDRNCGSRDEAYAHSVTVDLIISPLLSVSMSRSAYLALLPQDPDEVLPDGAELPVPLFRRGHVGRLDGRHQVALVQADRADGVVQRVGDVQDIARAVERQAGGAVEARLGLVPVLQALGEGGGRGGVRGREEGREGEK